MKKIFIYLALIIIFSQVSLADIIINEIMANPLGDATDESLNEWIELYNNGSYSINVSGWIIGDLKNNDSLKGGFYGRTGTVIPANGYAILTAETTRVYNNFEVSPYAIKLYASNGAIGNRINNENEIIYLYNQTTLIDYVEYSETKENKTLALFDGVWHDDANATPGYSNNGSFSERSENWCDWKVNALLDKTIFENETEFEFKVRATRLQGNSSTLLNGSIIIEDIYGNIVRMYNPWTNENRTYYATTDGYYTPNLGSGNFFIKSNISVECNDSNKENNFETAYFAIKSEPLAENSSLDIQRIYDLGSDNEAEFGQTIRVKLNVYKGNTTKNSIKLYVEDEDGNKASKQSKTNVYTAYTSYNLTIPIQLKPNCDEKLEDGDYIIVAEGLDTSDTKDIEIEGLDEGICKGSGEKQAEFVYELTAYPSILYTGEEFSIEVSLTNNDDEIHEVDIWSYVYRGSKCYSGEREDNKKHFVLDENSIQVIKLKNTVEEADSGSYKLKVKIKKDNQKTDKQITQEITIIKLSESEEECICEASCPTTQLSYYNEPDIELCLLKNLIEQNTTRVIYESTNIAVKELVPYFLLGLTSLISIILIWKR